LKLHRSTTTAVTDSLREIFNEGQYADKVIERTLKKDSRWGARDRRFIAETTYEIVRWYRLLKEIGGLHDTDFTGLLTVWCAINDIEIPPWLRTLDLTYAQLEENKKKALATRKFRESIPDWLDQAGETELGPTWDRELKALNEQAPVVLRVNTLKISRNGLRSLLQKSETDTTAGGFTPDALILNERKNVFQLPAFKEGLFELQDAGSQAIAPFLRTEPGMRVIDACAGGGGKTLHLAALMQNKGKILALDTIAWKLDELKKRARRAGAANIETRVIESGKSIKRLHDTADRLLLDVPCSGLGVLKRNPDAKWKLSRKFIDEVRQTQTTILNSYSAMLKPSGLMVYSTCSIFPSENEKQVEAFLASHDSFELIEQKHIMPSEGFIFFDTDFRDFTDLYFQVNVTRPGSAMQLRMYN
jgi:16S rRNA (cytosine967-C5)-methyltransferase